MTIENLFADYETAFASQQGEEMTLLQYLELCKEDPTAYNTAAQRMVQAIGEPVLTDTSDDPRLSRLFQNRKIPIYPTFADFFGMEDTIEQVVSFFKHSAQGLEERKQILYCLGPVGSGKSALVERIKELFESVPFYALKAGDRISPIYESPLGLLDPKRDAKMLKAFNISPAAAKVVMSPWATKRLKEFNGDIRKFSVVKIHPSQLKRIGIAKAEPGDDNNQDVSTLVGKVDIRKLEDFSQDDPDAYSFSGALNVACQGVVDFAEMFKAPIKTLNPLLTATQDGSYNSTEGFAALPFSGIIIAHSNHAEWEMFRNNKRNEAFIDRINLIKVPYCLRVTEEMSIYDKLLKHSSLGGYVCSPGTLEMLAQFSVLSRITDPGTSAIYSKMEVYDGKTLKETDPSAKSFQEYRDMAGVNEGMNGMSTRFAYKVLSHTFNYDPQEVAANPIHLMYVLEQRLANEGLPEKQLEVYTGFIKGILAPKYAKYLGDELQQAYLESYAEYGQNIFDRYVLYADMWIQDQDYRDPDTHEMFDRNALDAELLKIERPAGISNPRDFRNEVVNYVLRASRANSGKNPSWTSYEKLRSVIEKKMFSQTEDMLPVISFSKKSSSEEERKHNDFVERMCKKGYTPKQVRLLVDWHQRYAKHN